MQRSINTSFLLFQEITRKQRAVGEAAAQAKLDVEQQALADITKATTHPELYAKVSNKRIKNGVVDDPIHIDHAGHRALTEG